MQALLVDHATPSHLTFGELPDPVPAPGEVLIDVECFSVVGRTIRHAAMLPAGTVPGYDTVGTVIDTGPSSPSGSRSTPGSPSSSGSDSGGAPVPSTGTRVLALAGGGAWAERRAVPLAEVAVLPAGVDAGLATVLAVPGVSALRAIRRLGAVLGRRVLVTGATGAVGHFAVQLARQAGAYVIAAARDREQVAHLHDLGAAEVVADLGDVRAPVAGVVETVGGPLLGQAYDLLEEGGRLQSVGSGSGEPAVLRPNQLASPYRRIEGFYAGDRFGSDLTWLLVEAAAGRLVLLDGERDGWARMDGVAARLGASTRPSRAILSVQGSR